MVEFGADFGAVRDFVQAAEDLGYTHLRILDHVLGADPEQHPEVPRFPYTYQSYLHEPLTLMGYLAAVTSKINLVTGILILPQRQTALVAKQAAEVDVLSGGRLRLGLGVGWNPVEYQALGQNFHNRGRRYEEQIEVLRALWTQEVVSFDGRWHKISDAGINPMPVQRPIPLWMGAGSNLSPVPSERVLAPDRAIGRWLVPHVRPGTGRRRRGYRQGPHLRAGSTPARYRGGAGRPGPVGGHRPGGLDDRAKGLEHAGRNPHFRGHRRPGPVPGPTHRRHAPPQRSDAVKGYVVWRLCDETGDGLAQ